MAFGEATSALDRLSQSPKMNHPCKFPHMFVAVESCSGDIRLTQVMNSLVARATLNVQSQDQEQPQIDRGNMSFPEQDLEMGRSRMISGEHRERERMLGFNEPQGPASQIANTVDGIMSNTAEIREDEVHAQRSDTIFNVGWIRDLGSSFWVSELRKLPSS
jgi:hypothetical protein